MPAARAKAAEASFPTLVADGNVFLSMRRTHANGGSKSAADGNGCGGWSGVVADADAVAGCLEVGVVVDLRADAGSVVAAAESMAVGEVPLAVGELMVVCLLLLLTVLLAGIAVYRQTNDGFRIFVLLQVVYSSYFRLL